MAIRRLFRISLVVLTAALATVRAADVSGRWTATFNTDVGEQQYTFDFVVKGTTLTGTAKGNLMGEVKISDGKVEGNAISFVENASYMEMPLTITYTGTITSDDEIKFTRDVAGIAKEELTAKRAK